MKTPISKVKDASHLFPFQQFTNKSDLGKSDQQDLENYRQSNHSFYNFCEGFHNKTLGAHKACSGKFVVFTSHLTHCFDLVNENIETKPATQEEGFAVAPHSEKAQVHKVSLAQVHLGQTLITMIWQKPEKEKDNVVRRWRRNDLNKTRPWYRTIYEEEIQREKTSRLSASALAAYYEE